jgi:hypothetical protein
MAHEYICLVSRRDALSTLTALSVLPAALLVGVALAHAQPAQSVSIVEPANGATVTSPFKLRFAVSGMVVAPAGDIVANSGHHHLLIDADPIPAGTPVPADDKHIHFGKGQTEVEVTLPPGTYKLTAQFANGAHQSYGPAMSQSIKITVR